VEKLAAETLEERLYRGTAVVRGGGDLATGVIQKLWHAGFRVAVLEIQAPRAIRRTVALCSAVYNGFYQVEDVHAVLVKNPEDCEGVWCKGQIPVLVDPSAQSLSVLKPLILVDAILAKKNMGTSRQMAPVTIALGPGFSAPEDVDAVIESMRGHRLGRLILKGSAMPDTGIPGNLGGKTAERVIHAPVGGRVSPVCQIGDTVQKGELLFKVGDAPVYSPLDGVLRGLICEGSVIPKGLKCADVDPRPADEVDCYSISDKARCLGGAVLEACFWMCRRKNISV
jgi:xanthine dehydrogenase accessory factor